ncbi:MAG: helix-turn-helix domain-containing protein [Bacteroidota bacterium]
MRLLYLLLLSSVALQLRANNPVAEQEYLRRLVRENKTDSVLIYVDGRLSGSEQPEKGQLAYFHSIKSTALLYNGKFDESLIFTRLALANSPAVKDSATLSEIWKSASHSYNRNGKLDSALLFTKLLYNYARRANDVRMTYSALVSLGNIHLQNKHFQLSLDFYQEALNISLANNYKNNLPADYYNLGLAQYTNTLYPQAEISFEKAAVLGLEQNNLRLVARVYGSIADIMEAQNKYDEQLKYLKKANQIAAQLQDKRLLAMGCSNLMHLYLKKNEYGKVIEYGNQALGYLKQQPLIQLEIDIDSMMYVSHKASNQPEQAIIFHEAFTRLNNTLRNEEVTLRLNELKSIHEIEKKNLTIKNQTTELLAAQRSSRINMLVISVLSLLLLALLAFRIRENLYKRVLYRKEKETDLQLELMRSRLNKKRIGEENPETGEEASSPAEERDELSPEKSLQIFSQIMEIIETEKLYLSPELDQKYIVKRLNTNKRYIYESVRVHGDHNLKGLVNRLRINEAKRIIQERLRAKEDINLPEVYISSGFTSKTSFYRTFKSVTGLPPGDYVAQLERELK